jgi:monofunctional biosynthetic peptidoglycan transglycosylase
VTVSVRRVGGWLLGTVAWAFAIVAYTWLTLPDVRPLRKTNPTVTSFMELRATETRRLGKPVRRTQRWVSYDRIASSLKRAILITEDAAFFDHDGLDYFEIRASISDTIKKGEPLRGASTITQQLAKNLYLTPSRNPYRKLQELFITRRLEAGLSKRRIFELYLNVIEWGDGIWGCEAASRAFFDVPADALSADQAAMLAATVSDPLVFNPLRPSGRLLRKQEMIRRRMGDAF